MMRLPVQDRLTLKLGVFICLCMVARTSFASDSGLGVSSFGAWRPGLITKMDCPHLRTVPFVRRWHELEPSQDNYTFHEEFDPLFSAAEKEDLFVSILIYVGPDSPDWVYSQTPEVLTDHPINRYPYYFDKFYKEQLLEFVAEFGAYIKSLPPKLKDRIVFVFAAEGATADGAPYKGKLLPGYNSYAITDDQWNDFRLEVWQAYKEALPKGMPVMVNSDANNVVENEWLIKNVEIVSLKYGMFSHGYHISDAIQRLSDFRDLETRVSAADKPLLTHGEEDAEIFRHAWGNRNLPQAIYWAGIYATHHRVDVWNVPRELLLDRKTWETYEFFNRYAGLHDAKASPRAFIALRDGLNAADQSRFPVTTFGEASKRNQQRYVKIAEMFSAYGARMEDPKAATGGGMKNRSREGYNDVGWDILPGNYSRFMEQIKPGAADVGWWHVDVVKKGSLAADASPYSRFARGFQSARRKNEMRFDLHDDLFGDANGAQSTRLTVTYFDEVAGSTWELRYDNGNSMTPALQVTCTGSGTWKKVAATVDDAAFGNGGPSGCDLWLVNTDARDDIFHMVEVELMGIGGNGG